MSERPIMLLTRTIELWQSQSQEAYYIYRKPCDREPFIWEAVTGLDEAERKARFHAERDVDEYYVYDPRAHKIIFKAQQEWQPGLRPSTELVVDSQRI